VATLTPEQQAAVDVLTLKSRHLYEAIIKAKSPEALGLAIRDGKAFAALNDESIAAVAVAVVGYEKALEQAVAELAKQPTPEPGNGEKAPVVVPPEETKVLPPPTGSGAGKPPNKAA
jgi:hypothetical protein